MRRLVEIGDVSITIDAPEIKPNTINHLLDEMAGRVCDEICKYRDIVPEDDDSWLDQFCDKCPLNMI